MLDDRRKLVHNVVLTRDQWIDIIATLDVARSRYDSSHPFRSNIEDILSDLVVQTGTSNILVDVKKRTMN